MLYGTRIVIRHESVKFFDKWVGCFGVKLNVCILLLGESPGIVSEGVIHLFKLDVLCDVFFFVLSKKIWINISGFLAELPCLGSDLFFHIFQAQMKQHCWCIDARADA